MASVANSKKSLQLTTGADIAVQSLVNHGVDTIFAYPGGATIPLHQALTRFKDEIRVILPRQEQGGGFAAQGYARTTGKVGVCMVTSGPGATNLLTNLADAKLDSTPLLVITGQVGSKVIGTDAFQETPIVEVCSSITKHQYLITDVNDIARVFREAFHIATTGRQGPVLIDMPKDIQLAQTVPDFDMPMSLPGYHVEDRLAKPEQIAQIAAAIQLAKRPIIYAGGGVISGGASEELTKLARKLNIPVTNTLLGLGGFPGDDPLALGMLGMHGSVYANYAVDSADLLLAFGVRFDDRVTGKATEFAKHGKIVHVDIDPSEINKIKQCHISVVSDIKFAIAELNKAVGPAQDLTEWHNQITAWKKADPITFDQNFDGILAQNAIQTLWELTKDDDVVITTGVGQHQMWTAQYYKFRRPRRLFTSGGLATMGCGLPAAIGAKVAHPDKMVIDIDGDGSLLMNIQEMATSHCEKVPVKVMLLNNMHLGMVVQWEDRFNAGNRANTYLGPIDHPEAVGMGEGIGPDERYPDFVAIAKGFNWEAKHVSKKSELRNSIREMLEAAGSFLLDVQVPYQEHVLPMIPANMTICDLIRE